MKTDKTKKLGASLGGLLGKTSKKTEADKKPPAKSRAARAKRLDGVKL